MRTGKPASIDAALATARSAVAADGPAHDDIPEAEAYKKRRVALE